jgi:hypothetical protein
MYIFNHISDITFLMSQVILDGLFASTSWLFDNTRWLVKLVVQDSQLQLSLTFLMSHIILNGLFAST